ncbi:hypothetical protein [Oceanicoccus sagamiensis]|uniref:Uncharacterized protein n=1 Tax=Oceanicoccus sagamiensis TaxID=716816 RepID=A0A1X9NCK9_9GAMM|nr:hypothetical protein [Oceanicoccus sagamiensis]ARN74891.1 hypothetical protein BST96_12660 [Oceanicoccus sagamiensis]
MKSIRDTIIFLSLVYVCFSDVDLMLSIVLFAFGSLALRYYGFVRVYPLGDDEEINKEIKLLLKDELKANYHLFFLGCAFAVVIAAIYLLIQDLGLMA